MAFPNRETSGSNASLAEMKFYICCMLHIWVFPKIMVPPNHPIFNRVFHYKPSILGYPYFWKHPYGELKKLRSLSSWSWFFQMCNDNLYQKNGWHRLEDFQVISNHHVLFERGSLYGLIRLVANWQLESKVSNFTLRWHFVEGSQDLGENQNTNVKKQWKFILYNNNAKK